MRLFLTVSLLSLGACGGADAGERSVVGLVTGNEISCAMLSRAVVDAGVLDGAVPIPVDGGGAGEAEVLGATVRCWGQGGAPSFSSFGVLDGTLVLGDPSCVLSVEGRLRCIGRNDHGQLGNGEVSDTISDTLTTVNIGSVVAVATSRHGVEGGFACAITASSNRVSCWGAGSRGQLGQGSEDASTPLTVPGLTGASALTLGPAHACAIVTAAEGPRVECWGAGEAGQLGNGSSGDRGPSPIDVPNGPDAPTLDRPAQVSAGASHTCALDGDDGEVWCWGANDEGQLGDGTTTGRLRPVRVDMTELGEELGESRVAVAIAAGGFHTCALFAGGHVACWGSSRYGQAGRFGASVRTPRRIPFEQPVEVLDAGLLHTCALSAGEIYCWGAGPQLGRSGVADSSRPVRVAL